MSRFDQGFARGAEMLAMNNGSSVIYRRPDVNAVTLTLAMVGNVETREDFEDGGKRNLRLMRSLTISTGVGGIAAPTTRDEVEIDGELWKVEHIRMMSGNLASLELLKVGRLETARPGFRGRS